MTTQTPSAWSKTTLGEIADRIGDGLHGTPEYAPDGEYYFVNGNNIEDGRIVIKTDTNKVNLEEYEKYRKDLGENTILLSINGTIGNLARYNNERCILGKSAAYINVNSENSVNYVYYLMLDNRFQTDISKNANGSTIKNVSLAQLRNYSFYIPPLPEQKSIAAALSSLDHKIDLARQENKTLESIAQTLFKHWFVDFEFPNENGKPYKSSGGKMIDSELGTIPYSWKVGTVNDVIDRFSITYRCDKADLDPLGKIPILDQGSAGLYGYTSRSPDFIASIKNPAIIFANHTCNMRLVNFPFCAIQNIIPFRGKGGYDTIFVYYMTLGKVRFIEYKGHWPDFEQKKYVIAPLQIADKYTEIVGPLQKKIWNNDSEIGKLSKLRDTLLPKLMKGEIRV